MCSTEQFKLWEWIWKSKVAVEAMGLDEDTESKVFRGKQPNKKEQAENNDLGQ